LHAPEIRPANEDETETAPSESSIAQLNETSELNGLDDENPNHDSASNNGSADLEAAMQYLQSEAIRVRSKSVAKESNQSEPSSRPELAKSWSWWKLDKYTYEKEDENNNMAPPKSARRSKRPNSHSDHDRNPVESQPITDQRDGNSTRDLVEKVQHEANISHLTGPSAFQLEYKTDRKSVLHDFLRKQDWDGMLVCLQKLKGENSMVVQQELSRWDDDRQSTPLHIAVSKAPLQLITIMLSVIPLEFREDVLMALDTDGNSPLHIACRNLNADHGSKFFASIVKVLTVGAPHVHCIRNHSGDSPLSLLLQSSGMRAEESGKSDETLEKIAEELVQSILGANESLILDRNDDGATLMHVAAGHCVYDRVLKALIETNGGVALAKQADHQGMLPLHHLALCSTGKIPSAKSARRLIKAFPEGISQCSDTGDTPLHLFLKNIGGLINDKDEVKTSNTANIIKLLMGKDEIRESKSPLLMQNSDGVSWDRSDVQFHILCLVSSA
jgi:ankyrin repeat protein